MEKFVIGGGHRLCGSTRIKGGKNAVLPILAAAILTDEKVTIHDCPDISDIRNMLKILNSLGARTTFENSVITVSGGISVGEIPTEAAKEIRSSVFLLGPILARIKKAKVAYPGGCDIGLRPIDIHLKGFRELGIEVTEQNGYIICDASGIRCADIQSDKVSVGATENLMMAAVFTKGSTFIRNAAKEPEIEDLASFLVKMGAKIKGAGSDVIEIQGVDCLHGCDYTPIPDRIVAGTLLAATAICGGDVLLENVVYEHIFSLVSKLSKSSCLIKSVCDSIYISFKSRVRAFDIVTHPYPAFPTDMQSQFMAVAATAAGTSIITETVFETRFKQAGQLIKMGADITLRGDTAIVRGVGRLSGAEVTACELRGGAALVLAGLGAEGVTTVDGIRHIDRGYESFEKTLTQLQADITRICL